MRAYEIMFVLKPDLDEETVTEVKERLQKTLTDFGGEFLEEVSGWGKKRLAYSIEDYTEGVYYLWNFNGTPDFCFTSACVCNCNFQLRPLRIMVIIYGSPCSDIKSEPALFGLVHREEVSPCVHTK
jgi:small subunit ribosomal protein S6